MPGHCRADEAILRSLRKARARHAGPPSSSLDNAWVARRSYGSGSLIAKRLGSGQEVWIGLWYDAAGRRVKRHVGPKRTAGEKDGLTKTQAERALRKLIDAHVPVVRADRLTVGQAGRGTPRAGRHSVVPP